MCAQVHKSLCWHWVEFVYSINISRAPFVSGNSLRLTFPLISRCIIEKLSPPYEIFINKRQQQKPTPPRQSFMPRMAQLSALGHCTGTLACVYIGIHCPPVKWMCVRRRRRRQTRPLRPSWLYLVTSPSAPCTAAGFWRKSPLDGRRLGASTRTTRPRRLERQSHKHKPHRQHLQKSEQQISNAIFRVPVPIAIETVVHVERRIWA